MQIIVRDNNVDQALRALKKRRSCSVRASCREMKLRRRYEKPSGSAPASVPLRSVVPASSSASAMERDSARWFRIATRGISRVANRPS